MSAYLETGSRTIVAPDGRALVFSTEEYIDQICEGDACFVCGTLPGSREFNNEHVIPQWILRRYSLFDRRITLPNGQERLYGTYVMPCCSDCNSLLSGTVESPVSKLLGGGYKQLAESLDDAAMELLFIWFCLLFTKLHLNDRRFKWNPDRRRDEGVIADRYDWRALHHLHCVARATYTGAKLGPRVMGSVRIFRVEDKASRDQFDWLDLTDGQTLALRLGDVGVVAVLNDASMTATMLSDVLATVNEPIGSIALREIAARFATANQDIAARPQFATFVEELKGRFPRVSIQAKLPRKIACDDFDAERFGATLDVALRPYLGHLEVDGERDPERVGQLIRTGGVSFL